jgi:uncharacterized protein (TIGR03437 family)
MVRRPRNAASRPAPLRNLMRVLRFIFALIPNLALAGAPVIQNVVDSAGYGPRVAPGSLATIFGSALANGTESAGSFPLPTTLQGASVSIDGVAAPILYASAGQINFQVPSSTASGDASLVVDGPGGKSSSFTFTVTAEAPAIYQYGVNHVAAQNAGGELNSDSAPAASGSVITVYLTGQGAVSNSVTDGEAAPTSPLSNANATATATIGPLNASVQFLGLTPDFAGLAQANIEVPALSSGNYPLVVTVGGLVSASAVVSVSGSGNAYTSLLSLTGSVAFDNSDTSNVALYDNVAYICGDDQIVMVNISNLAAPTVIGQFGSNTLNGNGNRCFINTSIGTPFLVDIVGTNSSATESFAVYSLANPTSPSLLTLASTSYGHMENLSFSGVYGIITTSYFTYSTSNSAMQSQTGQLLIFNFANPASPVFLTSLQSSAMTGSGSGNQEPYSDVINQLYAYVASSTATGASTSGTGLLNVISVASPVVPTPVFQVTVPQTAMLMSFGVAGITLLATGNTAGQRNPGTPDFDFTGNLTLTTMDLTNVAAPAVIATTTTQLQVNGTFYTAAFSNGVFAIVNNPPDTDDFGPSSLMIVDARNPSNLLLYPFQTQFGFSGILTTTNGYLFAPTSLGLNIYQLQL